MGGKHFPCNEMHGPIRFSWRELVCRPPHAAPSISDRSHAEMLVFVMPGLVPGIHVLLLTSGNEDVDGRVKPGHDD